MTIDTTVLRNYPERDFFSLESKAFAEPGVREAAALHSLAPDEPGDAWRHGFAWRGDAQNGHEVLMAGRHYLIDPLPSRLVTAPPGTLHVVLLRFAHLHEHLDAVREALNKRHSVVVYSPWLYWEVLYHHAKPGQFRHWKPLTPDMFSDRPDSDAGTHVVIGFDTWMDLGAHSDEPDRPTGYFEGLRLHLSFAVSPGLPSLQAAFCCNGRKLIVQDELSWGIADAMKAQGAQHALTAYSGRVNLPKLNASLARESALQQRLDSRMAELQCWSRGELPCGAGDSLRLGPHAVSRASAASRWTDVPGWPWERPEAITQPAELPISLPVAVPIFCTAENLAVVERHAQSTAAGDCRWVVGIACGRPAALLSRRPELVGPLLPVTVPAGPAGAELKVLSLIQWQLEGVWLLAQQMGVERLDVVLLTTPQIEDGIRHEIERLASPDAAAFAAAGNEDALHHGHALRLSAKFPNLELCVHVAPQHLLWQLKPGSANAGVPPPGHSGSLYYNGHFGVLRVLLEMNASLSPEKRWTHALAMSHNNLGVFGDAPQAERAVSEVGRTAQRMTDFAASDHDAAVEVFELERGTARRWRELSYFTRPQQPAAPADGKPQPSLVKQVWFKTGWPEGTTAYFSSNTWYFDLCKLASLARLPFRQIESLQAGEPIDMLTWPYALGRDRPLSIGVFRHDLADSLPAWTNEFHRYRRFAVVLEDQQFVGLPLFDRLKLETRKEPPQQLLIPVLPAIKKNIWGGHQISQRKGFEPKWIGETWEISTHPAGPAMFVGTDLRKHPLQEALGTLNYMGKFLDCELPLSVQIHPPQAAMRYLANQPAGGRAHGDAEMSKEESFYIIATARRNDGQGQRTHLISGFDRCRLAAHANALLPAVALLDQRSKQVDKRYEQLIDALWKSIADRFLAPLLVQLRDEKQPRATLNDHALQALEKAFRVDSSLVHAIDFYAGRMQRVELPLYAAGAGVLCAIKCLGPGGPLTADFADLTKALRMHCEAAGRALHFDEYKLFSEFNAVQVSPGDWLRVPAGTPHAFQGGGNLIIEISNRSDATYRILDFGREFSGSPRPMHWDESMFCLSQHAFQNAGTIERYRQSAAADYGVCHKDLEWRLHDKQSGARAHAKTIAKAKAQPPSDSAVEAPPPSGPAFTAESMTFLFNLGDRLRIDTQKESCSLPAFSAAVATQGTDLALHLSNESRLLELRERKPAQAKLCLSPLARPLNQPHQCEAALLIEGDEGASSNKGGQHAAGNAGSPQFELQHGYRVLNGTAPLPDPTTTAWTKVAEMLHNPAHDVVRCLALPGHVRYGAESSLERGPEVAEARKAGHAGDAFADAIKTLSSRPTVTLGDAQAAALGEFHHPLGCLGPAQAGVVVHLSSGLCAGIWDQRLSVKPPPHQAGDSEPYEAQPRRKLSELLNHYSLIGAVGRWLCIDLLTSRLYIATDNGAEPVEEASAFWTAPLPHLHERVFKNEPPGMPMHPRDKSTPGNDVIRLSAWLSADAVALRCFLKVLGVSDSVSAGNGELTKLASDYGSALKQLAEKEREAQCGFGPVERWACIYGELVGKIPQQAIFRAVLEATSVDDSPLMDRYEHVIADVARELKTVIRCLRRVLAHAAPALDFSRTVIVTDAPIWNFGLTARTDRLLEQLRSNLGETQILRSRIGSGAARAAAGFAGYLDGRAPL